jgi:hypothetical protein
MKDRISSESEFISYIGNVQSKLDEAFLTINGNDSITLGLVVSVGTNNQSKVWFSVVDGELSNEEKKSIANRIEKLPAPDVKHGVVPFAFGLRVGKTEIMVSDLPRPIEWKEHAHGESEITEVIRKAWIKTSPKLHLLAAEDILMELQVLEPIGGRIKKPKDWFYTESHRSSNSFLWTISKEKPVNGGYDTGVRIQLFTGIKKGTGKSPEKFLFSFKESKKEAANKVLKDCPVKEQGLFSVICLETIETIPYNGVNKLYHILYSLFWNDEMDMVILSIAGTPQHEWDNYQNIFNEMRGFKIIDLSKFNKP